MDVRWTLKLGDNIQLLAMEMDYLRSAKLSRMDRM
jgi:hypothetical protein